MAVIKPPTVWRLKKRVLTSWIGPYYFLAWNLILTKDLVLLLRARLFKCTHQTWVKILKHIINNIDEAKEFGASCVFSPPPFLYYRHWPWEFPLIKLKVFSLRLEFQSVNEEERALPTKKPDTKLDQSNFLSLSHSWSYLEIKKCK